MRIIRTVRTLLLPLAIALSIASPACATQQVWSWPDPAKHSRVILYANQEIEDYMRDYGGWFKNDFLIGGLIIKDVDYGDSDRAMGSYDGIFTRMRNRHIITGTYVSGTTAIHEISIRQYPANAVSIEDMSLKTKYLGPWIREPEQQVVDLSDPKSKRELDEEIQNLWLHVPTLIRFVDNAAVHPKVARMQSWDLYCQNIKSLRSTAEIDQANAIFNVFARPWELSDKETKQLIEAVAGNGSNAISFPLPWSKSIKDNDTANRWAIWRYRQMLDHHIVVILIPSDDAPQADLLKWMYTWRRPKDRVYIATPFYEESPGP